MQKLLISTLIFLLIASNLLMIEAASAQSNPEPSVPEFTLRLVRASYNLVNSFTGVVQQVANNTIEVTIKNQPFTPYFDTSGRINTSLHYNIQVKGHFADDWTNVYSSYNYSDPWTPRIYTFYDYPIQSNSEYTTLSIPANYPDDSMVDFRVQAIIADVSEILLPKFSFDFGMRYHGPDDYEREIAWENVFPSSWSDTQTISLADGSVSDSTTSTILELSSLAIIALIFIALVKLVRKRK